MQLRGTRTEHERIDRVIRAIQSRLRIQQAQTMSNATTADTPGDGVSLTHFPELERAIRHVQANWNADDYRPIAWRRPVLGQLKALAKRVIRRVLRPAANLLLEPQRRYNGAVAHTLLELLLALERSTEQLRALQGRQELLERETEALRARVAALGQELESVDTLRLQHEDVRRRLARLENWHERVAGQFDALPPYFDYQEFERRFRGSPTAIAERQRRYLPYFAGSTNVLDLGCGRGEFLRLLNEKGIHATGVEINPDLVAYCRERGLNVVQADAVEYLSQVADNSLGGVFIAQVVEHLPFARTMELLHLCHRKLRPGGRLVVETPNPACVLAMVSHFVIDPTHIRPIHPDTMRFVFETLGFEQVTVHGLAPVAAEHRLHVLPVSDDIDPALRIASANFERLNELLYSWQDYAVIGTKTAEAP